MMRRLPHMSKNLNAKNKNLKIRRRKLKRELIEAFALDIIKAIDYDLWKEVKKNDEDGIVESITIMIEDFIVDNLDTEVESDWDD